MRSCDGEIYIYVFVFFCTVRGQERESFFGILGGTGSFFKPHHGSRTGFIFLGAGQESKATPKCHPLVTAPHLDSSRERILKHKLKRTEQEEAETCRIKMV